MTPPESPDAEEIRAHYGQPDPRVVAKQLTRLDRHARAFIALSPFLVIASADAEGRCDATPRGDAPGFVAVLDEATLLIPDRIGNRRVDTMMNVAGNPQLGLIFLVPGINETLRVNGLVGSMGRVGAAGDNAAMESFFALLQKNVLNRRRWQSFDQLRLAIVSWIERTYHRRRRQARLGKLTPVEFEMVQSVQAAAAA